MWPIFKKRSKIPETLHFKSNQAAYEYWCKYGNTTLAEGSVIPALIKKVEINKDKGNQSASLLLATSSGGSEILISPVADSVGHLSPGDLVAYKIFLVPPEVNPDLPPKNIPLVFSMMMGGVVAKLKPELDIRKGWKIDK